jgi:hypothetical protein
MNVVLWVVGLAATGGAIYFFNLYSKQTSENEGFHNILIAIALAVVACICAFVFFYKKTREAADQDISITKF